MKIQITFDVTEEQRVAIGLLTTDSLRPAPREAIEAAIRGHTEHLLMGYSDAYEAVRDRLIKELKV